MQLLPRCALRQGSDQKQKPLDSCGLYIISRDPNVQEHQLLIRGLHYKYKEMHKVLKMCVCVYIYVYYGLTKENYP